MRFKFIIIVAIGAGIFAGKSQNDFSTDPLKAEFVTEDVDRFWVAFEEWEVSAGNPFKSYIDEGTLGVKGFIPYRIVNADTLLAHVERRKADYLATKNALDGLDAKKKQIQAAYAAFKYWYPQVQFPPVYFVVGCFNSGGTVSKDGIIIGAEKLSGLDWIKELVTHELVHFQQKIEGKDNLLKQSLIEGGADFIAELTSGEQLNTASFIYGEAHENDLNKEFVLLMEGDDNTDWLYSTSGKDDRPNDLGYWIGYKITKAYWEKQKDKHQAIYDILHITNPKAFLEESGYLEEAIAAVDTMNKLDKTILKYGVTKETFSLTLRVKVPNKDDELFISGNQWQLGDSKPGVIKFEILDQHTRILELKVHAPARFIFSKGSWKNVGQVKGISGYDVIEVDPRKKKQASYEITGWISWE